jgi:hypothetical protein
MFLNKLVTNYVYLGVTIKVRYYFDIVSDLNRCVKAGCGLHLRVLGRYSGVYSDPVAFFDHSIPLIIA